MPLKLNLGLSKKLGLPDYGSIGASCNIELELPASILADDLAGFHRHVQQAYAACAEAVDNELVRRQEPRTAGNGGSKGPGRTKPAENGTARTSPNGHRASDKQLDYIRQLARQVPGMGVRRLEGLAQKMFGKPVAELTSLDASGLIDALKDVKAGKIDLDAVLSGEGR